MTKLIELLREIERGTLPSKTAHLHPAELHTLLRDVNTLTRKALEKVPPATYAPPLPQLETNTPRQTLLAMIDASARAPDAINGSWVKACAEAMLIQLDRETTPLLLLARKQHRFIKDVAKGEYGANLHMYDQAIALVNEAIPTLNPLTKESCDSAPSVFSQAQALYDLAKEQHAYIIECSTHSSVASNQSLYASLFTLRDKGAAILNSLEPKPATLGEAVDLMRKLLDSNATLTKDERETLNRFMIRVPK